jgi:hypothetical protein
MSIQTARIERFLASKAHLRHLMRDGASTVED